MSFIDGLASLPQLAAYSPEGIQGVKADALSKLQEFVPLSDCDGPFAFVPALDSTKFVQLGSFALPKGPRDPTPHTFNLQAPTTRDNAMRVVRACQVVKPILLEGSPGVGKTSLITALANLSGHRLCRINLSDQTDLIDLFGSDLPVEGGGPGEFAWKDAEFLKALQEGHWVLLDEMNLAPQAVLEGLNAVLDHRGTVFIPELGRSFMRHPSFRIFAAQNPLQQGGGRKGLPKSFVNRFSKVYVEELSPNDLMLVCRHLFPDCDMDVLRAMIEYNVCLNKEIVLKRTFARQGSPWEFNLRDVIRWGILLRTAGPSRHPVEYLRSTYLHRFRTIADRNHARLLFDRIFPINSRALDRTPHVSVSSSFLQIGRFSMPRSDVVPRSRSGCLLQMHHSALESAGHCVRQSWLAIITGPHDSGKNDMVRELANITGNYLHEISMNSATDAMDVLGSFEQVDNRGRIADVIQRVLSLAHDAFRDISGCGIRQSDDYYALRKAINQSSTSNSTDTLHSALNLLVELGGSIGHKKSESDSLQIKIRELLALPNGLGRFEWVDGPLVRALRFGYWMLLDGANLCSPSVLDRLNSLCEPDGVLTLNERGYVDGNLQKIKPHPNFRLFMSVDPQYGELSRAMRNRGLEIALLCDTDSAMEDQRRLRNHYSLPLVISVKNVSWNFISADFDSVRRGLAPPNIQYQLYNSDWPSGGNTNLDSSSSNLIDLAPFLSLSLSNSQDELDALLHFLSQATPLSCIPYFYRFLSVPTHSWIGRIWEVLRNLVGCQLSPILSHIRQECGLSWGVPSDFVLTQVSADISL
jgi:midasin